jgi:hypothetical protein
MELENLTDIQLVKKFPEFYGTRSFITTFTSARHLPLSWANSIQSMPPHLTSWWSIKTGSSLPKSSSILMLFCLNYGQCTQFRNKWDMVIKELESAKQRNLTWSNHASSDPTEQIRHIKYLAKLKKTFSTDCTSLSEVYGESGRVFRRCSEGWKKCVEEWVASDGNYFQGNSMLMK